ncbi:hypothetical protein Mnod_3682 [Methylobacterium nodulans ORS 2060]|uniref:Uncharacterized protein n=1 Tax=Methylobacterium nodulans (strain LMG 21967 / CNCM I-2342 / ORS 2060) TaxID=460265 RepID=B8IQ89_METNO|nr:hypothetical protein Mnod_3682 [Methylobacterium nodulans ORS 2060]
MASADRLWNGLSPARVKRGADCGWSRAPKSPLNGNFVGPNPPEIASIVDDEAQLLIQALNPGQRTRFAVSAASFSNPLETIAEGVLNLFS